MTSFLHEKNSLAALAIPVLLSIIFGFTSTTADASFLDYDTENTNIDEPNDGDGCHDARRSKFDLPKKTRVHHAIESEDYYEFLSSIMHTPFAEIMTEDAFVTLVQTYNSQKNNNPQQHQNFRMPQKNAY